MQLMYVDESGKKAQVEKPGTSLRPDKDKRSKPSRLTTNITQILLNQFQKI